jgi:hypothetical protein
VEFCSDFLMVNDIDIHQLNLEPFKIFKILAENPITKCVFCHFLSNKCMINFYFWEKIITLRKKEDIL